MAGVSKYFMIEITPTMKASVMHAGDGDNYAVGDVLFPINNKIQIPSGPTRLLGATALIRPKGDADPTPNNFAFDLIFSKESLTQTGSKPFASVGGGPSPFVLPTNDIVGSVKLVQEDHVGHAATSCTSVVTSGTTSSAVVLNRGPEPCTVVADRANGYDTYYVGAIANGAFDFSTLNRINDEDIDTAAPDPANSLVADGTDMDLREHFLPGDVIHTHEDVAIGTVASIINATSMTFTENYAHEALEDDDFIYTPNPIRIKLFFEK